MINKLNLKNCIKALLTSKRKFFVIGYPSHPNLGDQAQLYCINKLINEHQKNAFILHLSCTMQPQNLLPLKKQLISFFSFLFVLFELKAIVRKKDVFVGHSGYLMTDHHPGWINMLFLHQYFPHNKMIILPQTINFYSPILREKIQKWPLNHETLTILCRDEQSYENAQTIFEPYEKHLYPDVVTSLIGSRSYSNNREKVLFCIRNDQESFYSKEVISELSKRIGIEVDFVDTTIDVEINNSNREKEIFKMIEKFSTYKVVVTDRYHGTIFSVISGTPVVVLASTDHKLESGVKWFPQDVFGQNIAYAKSIEEANEMIINLVQEDNSYTPIPYFKENYYNNFFTKMGV